jgi:hypothetical protein
MTPQVAARAFDPFFTTKEMGKGTGLGLSQVYGMVRQAGGTARIEHLAPHGTRVSLLVRYIDPPHEATAAQAVDEPQALGRGRTILVVDDDPDVREHLAQALDTLGFTVASRATAKPVWPCSRPATRICCCSISRCPE